MAQILFFKVTNWIDALSNAEIYASDELRVKKYCAVTAGDMEPEIRDDGFYACPENPTGRGWDGSKFGLLIFQDADKVKAEKIKEKVPKEIPLSIGTVTLDLTKYVVDLSKLPTPEIWNINDVDKYIYREKEFDKIKMIDKTNLIIEFPEV